MQSRLLKDSMPALMKFLHLAAAIVWLGALLLLFTGLAIAAVIFLV